MASSIEQDASNNNNNSRNNNNNNISLDMSSGLKSETQINGGLTNSNSNTSTTNTTTTTIAATGSPTNLTNQQKSSSTMLASNQTISHSSRLKSKLKRQLQWPKTPPTSPPIANSDQASSDKSIVGLPNYSLVSGQSFARSNFGPGNGSLCSYSSSQLSLSSCASISPTSVSSSRSSRSPIVANLLDYYPELNHDGLALTWAHSVNTRDALLDALWSDKLIIGGDISLAEMSRYPVPIMARPPRCATDMTLENWLQEVVGRCHQPRTLNQQQPHQQHVTTSYKAIKLTFTSTRTIEPAFRVLARHSDSIKGPLILAANILKRPTISTGNNQAFRQTKWSVADHEQPVDAWTFLMLCRTRFPKSIISIGWCSPPGSDSPETPPSLIRQQVGGGGEPIFELDILDSHQQTLRMSTGHASAQQASAHPALSQLISAVPHHLQASNGRHQRVLPYYQLPSQVQSNSSVGNAGLANPLSIVSSGGSLNSSSGNSSGSPSPTSPIGHQLSSSLNGHQILAASLISGAGSLHHNSHQHLAETNSFLAPQLIAAGHSMDGRPMPGKRASVGGPPGNRNPSSELQLRKISAPANANAAAMAALALVAASTSAQQQQPLNLNINEAADRRLPATTNGGILAKRLLNGPPPGEQHVHKKAALTPNQSLLPANSRIHSAANENYSRVVVNEYTREMIDKMASLVKEYNLTQPVTFPVEAKIMLKSNSLCELQRLLYQVGPNSTLTVMAQPNDLISVDDLLIIRKAFATNQLIYDLPDDLAASFRLEL